MNNPITNITFSTSSSNASFTPLFVFALHSINSVDSFFASACPSS
jgi:hypothetical protein